MHLAEERAGAGSSGQAPGLLPMLWVCGVEDLALLQVERLVRRLVLFVSVGKVRSIGLDVVLLVRR